MQQSTPAGAEAARAGAIPLLAAALGGAMAIVVGALVLGPGRDSIANSAAAWLWLFPAIILAIVAAVAAGTAVLTDRCLLAALFVLLCGVVGQALEMRPLHFGFFNVYAYDLAGLGAALSLGVLFLTARPGDRAYRRPASRLSAPILALLVMGSLQAIRAVALGLDFNDALGDYRRGYFYLLAFFFPLVVPERRRMLRYLEAAFVGASTLLVVKGFLQLLYRELERRAVTDAAHILNQPEAVFAGFLLFYATGHLLQGTPLARRYAPALYLGLTASAAVVFFSNFRSVWMSMIVGAVLFTSCLPWRYWLRAVVVGIAALVVLSFLITFLWRLPVGAQGGTLGQEIEKKIDKFQNFDRDMNVIWRFQSYEAALTAWQAQPLLGTGLGTKNEFFSVQSDGSFMRYARNRTHNGYLWILQTTGIVGMALFLWLHGSFLLGGIRRAWSLGARKTAVPPLFLAIVGFYGSFMCVAAFDVILETSTQIILLMFAFAASEMTLAHANGDDEPEESAT